ncbi:LysR family transcriptional regulator [Pantoea sp.]|uniref:LysR family transcriptional regulator n=1 Tax=Pantoea sp. TaxID=69393 RepID=UPI0028A69C9B|nr:LysR family transcriptional regulator [Pantoea sp.]
MATAAHLISNTLPSVKQLQCFLAVAHELNFRRAAERLSMTQPPLTRHIQSLEALLHQQLFSRSTHTVSLTEAGRALVARAESILEALSALHADALSRQARLRIGLTRTLDFTRIPPVGARLAQLDAGDDIDSPDLTSARLLQCLTQNRLDLVLTGEKGAGNEESVRYRWICREPLLIALPTTHPASRQHQVSLDEVSDLPLFWFARRANPAFYDKCEKVFAQLPAPLKKVKEPDDTLTMLAHIARGKGFALLPQSKCAFNQAGLCYRPLRDSQAQQLNIDVYAATRHDDVRPALLQALARLSDGAP